jgi:hypothetical protein
MSSLLLAALAAVPGFLAHPGCDLLRLLGAPVLC